MRRIKDFHNTEEFSKEKIKSKDGRELWLPLTNIKKSTTPGSPKLRLLPTR